MKSLTVLAALALSLSASALTPEQAGGIYYAYPQTQTARVSAPDGYRPFYISHYGRHGSRWITDDYRYSHVTRMMDSIGGLTVFGREIRERLDPVLDDALGRSGSITPLGERQHHDIAARMIAAYPEVFADTARVEAVSSTSLRCAMSMSYFTEALKEANPALRVHRSAYNKDMDYIAYTTPEGKKFSAKDSEWYRQFLNFCTESLDFERILASLFDEPERIDPMTAYQLVDGLYWIASDMQNTDLGLSFYDVFTPDELEAFWKTINARMYICNADAPIANGVMKHCADNLLSDIIARADEAVDGGEVAANLRFGHDTHLLRLLALMGIDGTRGQATDFYEIHNVWRDYELSPMAANLQLIFYRNDSGDVLVRILLNEQDRGLLLPEGVAGISADGTAPGPFYRWPELRKHLCSLLNQ